jgi:hypothetical protein
MRTGLTIAVVYSDEHLLTIEIVACNDKFMGTTRVYMGLDGLTELAREIAGFPSHVPDARRHDFGNREPQYAGGYCDLYFRTINDVGAAVVEVEIIDEDGSSAKFSVPVEASAIDRFAQTLLAVEASRSGTAKLEVGV